MKIYSSNSIWNSNSKQQFDYLWNTEYLSNVFGTYCAQHSWRRLEKCLTVKALRLLRTGRTELVEVKCNRTVKLLVNHYQYCSVTIVYSNKTRTHYQRMCFPLTTISGPLNEAWKSISLRRHCVGHHTVLPAFPVRMVAPTVGLYSSFPLGWEIIKKCTNNETCFHVTHT